MCIFVMIVSKVKFYTYHVTMDPRSSSVLSLDVSLTYIRIFDGVAPGTFVDAKWILFVYTCLCEKIGGCIAYFA